ncbi:MAG: PIN domain-containing protein [Rhizobiaceae bacterium]|nr:PIN domain-containing protein [Rhizobiaceae bacterium]
MPGSRVFVDTNALLYLHDRQFPDKRTQMAGWLSLLAADERVVINLQVLNELTNVLIRKKYGTPETVFEIVDRFAVFGSTPLTADTMTIARGLHQDLRYSWWDCLLLASAFELGCSHFLSEDMQNGHSIELRRGKRLTIADPFAHTPGQFPTSP